MNNNFKSNIMYSPLISKITTDSVIFFEFSWYILMIKHIKYIYHFDYDNMFLPRGTSIDLSFPLRFNIRMKCFFFMKTPFLRVYDFTKTLMNVSQLILSQYDFALQTYKMQNRIFLRCHMVYSKFLGKGTCNF